MVDLPPKSPPSPSALVLALRYHDAGLVDQAWESLSTFLDQPNPPHDAVRLGAVLRYDAGDFSRALVLCEQALSHVPDDQDMLLLRGRSLLDLRCAAEAVQGLRLAVAANPKNAVAHFNFGLALEQVGQWDAAAEAYRVATTGQTPYPEAWNNLGLVLERIGQAAAAAAAFEAAINEAPDFHMARANLGALLIDQGHLAAAIRACAAATASDPTDVSAHINLGVALLEQGRHREARAAFAAACELSPENRDAADNALYLHHYASNDPAAVMAAHVAWRARVEPSAAIVSSAKRHVTGRLRVGYVSPDFRRHSVSFFTEPLLTHHNHAVVEVFCYADGQRPDDVTRRLKAGADHWRDLSGRSDEDAYRLIREDGIDILVDLAGHTKGNRLGIFAKRAAPVQVTALGYPGTTGLKQIDFRLCDEITDPPGSDVWASERLVRLPHGLHCYQPPVDAPAVAEPPSRTRDFVTFGSFNKLGKVSDEAVALWAQVLAAVSGSRLLVKSRALAEEETRVLTAARFAAHGIAADRLMLLSWIPDGAGHLAAYGQVDIALDTFPYSGTTTTCEALWMGVPVLTLTGATHASRVSTSLLAGIGLHTWAVGSASAFVVQAAAMAADPAGLRDLRRALRGRMRMAPLCDGAGYAAAIEAAYRAMWSGDIPR
ncbi:MAG: tetratricopeptide repeat protein [Rhodospirillaceae bacterium]|nr:MAG: tetratricopeptide repeat protein [Rhodospirillaceae bacterium]